MGKADQQTLMRRRAAVELAINSGHWSTAKVQELARVWDVRPRQIWADRKWLQKEWTTAIVEETQIDAKARGLEQLRQLFAQCTSEQEVLDVLGEVHKVSPSPLNLATAAKLLETQNKMLGTYEPERVEVHLLDERTDVRVLALSILKDVPEACRVLGVDCPQLPVIDVAFEEVKADG